MLEVFDSLNPILLIFGFLAGAIDAMAGGGGLIQLPALFVFQPNLALGNILGCNKMASISGTSFALFRYNKVLNIQYKVLIGGIITAFIGSLFGAKIALEFNKDLFIPFIILALIIVFVYTLFKNESNITPQNRYKHKALIIALCCLLLGFYDGCIGPGTGSFILVMLLFFLPINYLEASAHAKIINISTNLAALCYFIPTGNINWYIAIPLAFSNILGSLVGSKFAIQKGSRWVKWVYCIVIIVLIIKMTINYFKLYTN
jgi:uncharacterized membrane protein YfcA